jgi:hypothetical protein
MIQLVRVFNDAYVLKMTLGVLMKFGGLPGVSSARAEVQRPVLRERPDDRAGRRIECVQEVADTSEQPRLAACRVLPVRETALSSAAGARPFRGGIPPPQLLAGGGVKGNHFSCGRRRVEHTADDEIVRLIFAAVAGVIPPRNSEARDVALRDLRERGVVAACVVTEIHGPVAVLRTLLERGDELRRREDNRAANKRSRQEPGPKHGARICDITTSEL